MSALSGREGKVCPTGLVISPWYPWLGASPKGITEVTNCIVEGNAHMYVVICHLRKLLPQEHLAFVRKTLQRVLLTSFSRLFLPGPNSAVCQ